MCVLMKKNDKSGTGTLVNLIRLHSCCLNNLTVTAKADASHAKFNDSGISYSQQNGF